MTQEKTAIIVIFGHFLTTQKFNFKKLTHFFSKLQSVSIQAIERETDREILQVLTIIAGRFSMVSMCF